MKLTFLGTGTSQGVPMIGCRCEVCTSTDPRDTRLRTSAMVECGSTRIIIDAGPDFRYQMLRAKVDRLDAILLTHHHMDHIGGIDDVRAFNFVDYPTIRPVDIYANSATARHLLKQYDYAFGDNRYRGVPEIRLHEIFNTEPFHVKQVEVMPVEGFHARGVSLTAYRIGALGYLTDIKSISPESIERLRGVDTLVINALRWTPHDTHLDVEEALGIIEQLSPRQAFLTHASHDIGLHSASKEKLPPNVALAYDTLQVEVSE